VFIYTSVTVFGFRVFKEIITQTFYVSVAGILALMIGAFLLNVMFNLTRIADHHTSLHPSDGSASVRRLGIIVTLSLPILFSLLYAGDRYTRAKKESLLLSGAQSIIQNDRLNVNRIARYSFDEKWLLEMHEILYLQKHIDRHFPNVYVIVSDTLGSSPVFLGFESYYGNTTDSILPDKQRYVWPTTQEERQYLSSVFYHNNSQYRFSASDGSYELFYPYVKDGNRIVFYFSDYQRYGKVGS